MQHIITGRDLLIVLWGEVRVRRVKLACSASNAWTLESWEGHMRCYCAVCP